MDWLKLNDRRGVNTRNSTMHTSRNLQLYSIIFLLLSTFTTAWPWPRWLPELDSLIVRQDSGNGTTGEFANASQPLSTSNYISQSLPRLQERKRRARHRNHSFPHPQKRSFQRESQPQCMPPKHRQQQAAAMPTKQPVQTTHPTMLGCPLAESRCSHPPPSQDSSTSKSETS